MVVCTHIQAAAMSVRAASWPGRHPAHAATCHAAGGEGAPDLQETLQNFGINSAALAVLGFFV